MAPDGGNIDRVDAYAEFFLASLYASAPIDNPGSPSGSGGMEAWNGSEWILCDGWFWYDDPGNNVDFSWSTFSPQPGMPWRLTAGATFTVNGQPLSPRSGTFSEPPAMKAGQPPDAKWSALDANRPLPK